MEYEEEYLKEAAYINSQREIIEWRLWLEEFNKDQKPAKITVEYKKEEKYDVEN